MIKTESLAFASVVLLVCPAVAQTSPAVVQQPAAAAVTVGAPQMGQTLRTGTSVPLRTLSELTTEGKKLKVGHRFNLEVSEPVSLDGQTVIPVGSRAVGEVIGIKNKGMWGQSGRIDARILYVDVNGKRLRLAGNIDDKGVTGTAGVVGAIAVVPIAGFFVTGTSARIPAGSTVTAFLDEDVPVSFASGTAAAPLVVPASATAPQPATN